MAEGVEYIKFSLHVMGEPVEAEEVPDKYELARHVKVVAEDLAATQSLVRELAAARESDRKKMNQMAKILKPIYWGPDGPGGQRAIAHLKRTVQLDEAMEESSTPEVMQDLLFEKVSGMERLLKETVAENEKNAKTLKLLSRQGDAMSREDAPPAKRIKVADDNDDDDETSV